MPFFTQHVGIDYSGAETPTSSLSGLRVYLGRGDSVAVEGRPPAGPKRHWTRRGIAEWLVDLLRGDEVTLVGIDHAFSLRLEYFQEHSLALDWTAFLQDFCRHWPTNEDHIYVDFVREGRVGDAASRSGSSRWRRLVETWSGAKSAFQFDVQGQVAKSTHAGIPWLRFIRKECGDRVFFWPFDGWELPAQRSAIVEVYPSLWHDLYPAEGRTGDQHDAFSVAEWMRQTDRDGRLDGFLNPPLRAEARVRAGVEGWILGVLADRRTDGRGRAKGEARLIENVRGTGTVPEPLKPEQFQIVGKPWSLIFAPHLTLLDRQGVWLFNQETGELWELIANNNFVPRPRQTEGGKAGEGSAG